MTHEALISIITPVYNAEKFIESTLKSVLAQTYKNWEHLVVLDQNSTDRSLEIIKNYGQQNAQIKLIRSPLALGAAANRNLALQVATGEYVAFLDADDLWIKNKLEMQLQFMQKNNYEFSFTAFSRINEDSTVTGKKQEVPQKLNYSQLLKNNCIACLTTMFKREKFKDLRFQEKGWEDMALWLQILKRTEYAYGLNENLASYRIVKGSRSNNKFFAAKLRWQTYTQVEKLNLFHASYLFLFYIASSLRKYVRF